MARALIRNPSLLLLDEPTEGLSPMVVKHLLRLLREVQARGTTILLIEQRLKFACSLADRAVIMLNGRIPWDGPSVAVRDDVELQHRYLGTS